MAFVGYEKLRQHLGLAAFDIERPAQVMSVTRIEHTSQGVWVPKSTAPATDDPLDHLLFALKHEGVNLPIIVQAVPRIPPERLSPRLGDFVPAEKPNNFQESSQAAWCARSGDYI